MTPPPLTPDQEQLALAVLAAQLVAHDKPFFNGNDVRDVKESAAFQFGMLLGGGEERVSKQREEQVRRFYELL